MTPEMETAATASASEKIDAQIHRSPRTYLVKEDESPQEALTDRGEGKNAGCDFCKVARNEVARRTVFQDDISVGFLDINPVFQGHCLLIPRKHYETIFELPKDQIGPLFFNAQLLAKAVKSGLSVDGIFLAVNNKVSQSVPHLHIHIIPRKYSDGLRGFFWPRTSYKSEEQKAEICNLIREAVKKIQDGN